MAEPSVTAGMKAGGFYDAHSEYQRRVVEAGAATIARMVADFSPNEGAKVWTVADYGCGTGATTAQSMGIAVKALRARSATQPIQAVHSDQVTNDFNQVLRTAHETYAAEIAPPLFVSAVGGSFFDQVLPSGSVHLGMCSNAAHWFRRQPQVTSAQGIYFSTAGEKIRKELAKVIADDWLAFLSARAKEMLAGGQMLVQGIAILEAADGREPVSAEELLRLMDEVARTLVEDGMLSRAQLASYIFPVYCRSRREATAPMQPGGALADVFTVAEAETAEVSNPYWEEFERSGDAPTYAKSYTAFVRAFAESTLQQHLFAGGESAPEQLSEEFFRRLERAIAQNPERGRYRAWILRMRLARR